MLEPARLLALFAILSVAGILLAIILPERRQAMVLAWLGSAASIIILVAGAEVLIGGASFQQELWPLASLGRFSLALDRISALFLIAVGLVFLPVSIFSSGYLERYLHEYSLRYFAILYYSFLASLVLVLVCNDAFLFIVAWEIMSVLSYLLVAFEHRREESTHAAYLMIAMSEAGAIAMVVAFALLANASGHIDFEGIRVAAASLGAGLSLAVFLLSFFGFAVKAGLIPLNSWLPLAHPVAPTNVSALLSGAMVNLGIYGILRVNVDLVLPAGAGRGLLVLVIGSASALVGILYATIQTDLKRMLAHSTIENMGIVAAALGAGMVFLAAGFPVIAGIAWVTALYHMVNHSLYKTLLFISSGAVQERAGTRDLDRLGGLIRVMPWTGVFVLVGIMSISALPPSNGFVTEWLMLQTILRSAALSSSAVKIVFALSGAALALTAALAVTCFVKAFAMGFLGLSRSPEATQAREAKAGALVPLAFLSAMCLMLGITPTYVIPVLDRVIAPVVHESVAQSLVPPFFTTRGDGTDGLKPAFVQEFHDLGAQVGQGVLPGRGLVVLHRGGDRNPVVFAMSTSYMVAALAVLLLLFYGGFRLITRARSVTRRTAWDGGLRRLLPQITYTSTGFSNPVRVIFHAILRPAAVEDTTEAVAEHFRTAVRREYAEVHIVDRLVLQPTILALRRLSGWLRRMHIGNVNAYATYVLAMILLVLIVGRGEELLLVIMRGLGIEPAH